MEKRVQTAHPVFVEKMKRRRKMGIEVVFFFFSSNNSQSLLLSHLDIGLLPEDKF